VGFEPIIPAFERAKTVHALDRAATVIDNFTYTKYTNFSKIALLKLPCRNNHSIFLFSFLTFKLQNISRKPAGKRLAEVLMHKCKDDIEVVLIK
jgi:hypothetical protein